MNTMPSIYDADAYVVIDLKDNRRVVYRGDWRECQKFRHLFVKPNNYDIIPADH